MKGLTIIGYVTFAFFVAGCASGGNLVEARNCPAPEVDIEDYSIGVGDRLNIVVWRNDELSASVPVRPDGKISTPLIDDMQAAGKTPSNLAENMEDVLGEYIRTPEVSVIVTGQGAANQIQVVGEVLQPQALSYREDLRMLDVIVAVGGMTDFAAGNRTKLVRQVSAGQVECSVRLKDLVSGDMEENVAIFPGDVIIVPESRF